MISTGDRIQLTAPDEHLGVASLHRSGRGSKRRSSSTRAVPNSRRRIARDLLLKARLAVQCPQVSRALKASSEAVEFGIMELARAGSDLYSSSDLLDGVASSLNKEFGESRQ